MNRRVYGVSGDKIKLDFRVNGVLMGGETPHTTGKRHIYASVEGRDWVGCVELLKNNTVIYRDFPVDKNAGESVWNKPLILRMQYGWAGMAANQVPQDKIHPVYDWDITCSAGNTNIAAVEPYWQEGPFDENRRHILSDVTANGFRLKSYHSRRRAFEQRDTHEVALIIDSASPRDSITLSFAKPDKTEAVVKLGALMEHDHNIKLNGGSCKLRRLVPSVNANTAFTVEDTSDGASDDWYYIRVFQKNGQMAWSSPVWVNGA
jgi:hypothetical protein